MRKLSKILLFSLGLSAMPTMAQSLDVTSPNGLHRAVFNLTDSDNGTKEVRYDVTYKGNPVVSHSRAGLNVDNRVWELALGIGRDVTDRPACWMDDFSVDSVSYGKEVDNVWHPLYGERSTITEHYNSGTIYLSKHDYSHYRLNIEVRAYNEGIAFRYFFPEHPQAVFHKVVEDLTEYTFPDDVMAWSEQWAQAPFEKKKINDITKPVERALTLEYPQGFWTALTDADVDDWCLTKFVSDNDHSNTLKSVMYSPVDIVTYYATPWKVIMTADSPGELLEHNDIIVNLNPKCEIADPSWIKPGKIMRETTITTQGGLDVIDFCAAHKIPYMLFDWKWYEPCTSHDGDATQVVDKLDMAKVIAYGKEKGVGVWLYVNQHALMKQQEELFPLLHKWGVVGVKSGFVQYASHRWATWLHDMVRYAARNELMMNIHDEYRPSGFSRTYPNLLTQEGIHGNEEWPDATHNVTLPFTRMINGAADYTICYFDRRLKNTHAHQLAASLVFYSPLLTILWYDSPSRYHGEQEIEWFENLETTFDDTKVIDGYPGRNIVMARRKGDTWWAALMTNNDARSESLRLDFLNDNQLYVARIYTDSEEISSATLVKCQYLVVNSKMTLNFNLVARGGAAVQFVPCSKAEAKQYAKYKKQVL